MTTGTAPTSISAPPSASRRNPTADPQARFRIEAGRHPMLTPRGELACARRIAAGRLAAYEAFACLPAAYDAVAGWRAELLDGGTPWSLRNVTEIVAETDESAGGDEDRETVERMRAEALAAFDAVLRHSNQVPYNDGPGSIPGAREAFAALRPLPHQHDRLSGLIEGFARELAAIDAEAGRLARAGGLCGPDFASRWSALEPDLDPDFGGPAMKEAVAALSSFGERVRLSIGAFRRTAAFLRRGEAEMRAAKTELAHANLGLVATIAADWRRSGIPFGDLIQEGNIGLMRAADKYDPALGSRFRIYAAWWIRQGVARAVAEQGRTVRLPVYLTEAMAKVARAAAAFRRRHGRAPTDLDIADATGFTPDQVRRCRAERGTLSLETEIGGAEGERLTLGATVADERAEAPDEGAHRAGLGPLLTRAMGALSPREERVLRLRYGIGCGVEAQTCQAIGASLGLSGERVRQIEIAAVARLGRSAPGKAVRAAA